MAMSNGQRVAVTNFADIEVLKGIAPDGQPRPVRTDNDGNLVVGPQTRTAPRPVTGIGTAAAYTTADAFGGKFALDVPVSGTILNIIFLDKDNEALNKELVLFSADFTATADNAAFAPTDADIANCIGVVAVDTWFSYNANAVGIGTPALGYIAPSGRLWGQFVTRGADNIADGSIPLFSLVISQ